MRFRQIKPSDPKATKVEEMVDSAFGFYGAPYWRWKYASPEAPPGIIVIAEADEDVVGCSHYVSANYHLGGKTHIEALFGGDLLVAPELRRRHIATELSLRSREIAVAKRPEARVVTMYTWRALGAHYEELLGYTRLKPGFAQWSKRLNWDAGVKAVLEGNQALIRSFPRLETANHGFRLELSGSPPLDFDVGEEGFIPGRKKKARVTIKVDNAGLAGGGGGKARLAPGLLKAFVTGRIRVTGSPRALWGLILVRGAYQRVLATLRKA